MGFEREAYDYAMNLLFSTAIETDSIRPKKYYSSTSYTKKLEN
ncbi:MAG: hypothetical protein QXJ62_07065 [Nitrososphaeria archaeon]